MKKIVIAILFFLAVLLSLVIPFFLDSVPQEHETLPDNYVIRVIDGDTIELASGEIVRLLCINAPEKGKEGYEESRDFLESLILNKEVILESDVEDRDDYNRSLRYVYINNSGEMIFINKEMYKEEHAEMMVIPPSTKKCEEITSLVI